MDEQIATYGFMVKGFDTFKTMLGYRGELYEVHPALAQELSRAIFSGVGIAKQTMTDYKHYLKSSRDICRQYKRKTIKGFLQDICLGRDAFIEGAGGNEYIQIKTLKDTTKQRKVTVRDNYRRYTDFILVVLHNECELTGLELYATGDIKTDVLSCNRGYHNPIFSFYAE